MAWRSPRPRSYLDTILADRPLSVWRFSDAGIALRDATSSRHGTYTATGVSHNRWAPLPNDPAASSNFDAVAGAASAVIDLSAYSTITVEFWANWTTYADNDQLLAEYTPNYNSANGFLVDPNASGTGAGNWQWLLHGSGGVDSAEITRPSAGVWHLMTCVYDYTGASIKRVIPYVDGRAVSYTTTLAAVGGGPFANSTLYFMSRATTSLFGGGYLANFAIYPRALTSTQILEHYRAVVSPASVRNWALQSPLLMLPTVGAINPGRTWRRRFKPRRVPPPNPTVRAPTSPRQEPMGVIRSW